jgi:arylformamidase
MGKSIIDISVSINESLPVWPGSPGAKISQLMEIGDDSVANVSHISIESHTGTHIDAPLHFVKNGKTTAEIPLDKLIGPCQVIEVLNTKSINTEILKKIDFESGVKKILFKTDNQKYWKKQTQQFEKDYTALSPDGAQFLVDMGIELVGIDYLSIQRFHDPIDTHTTLLQNSVVILETINLCEVNPGLYRLICLPLKVDGVEGCPVRAVLETT